jgi:hypothetical protein
MYVNGKVISVETSPGMGVGGIKKNSRGNECNNELFDIL